MDLVEKYGFGFYRETTYNIIALKILWDQKKSSILSVLQVFRDPVLLILRVIAVFRHLVLLILSILGSISGFHTARCSNTRSISGFYTARYCWLEYYSEYIHSNAEVFRGLILSILGVLPIIVDVLLRELLVPEHMYCSYPVLAVFGPSVLLILQILRVFRPPVL